MLYGNLIEFIVVLASIQSYFCNDESTGNTGAAWLQRAILAGQHVGRKEDKLSFAQGEYSPFRKMLSVQGNVKKGTWSSEAS